MLQHDAPPSVPAGSTLRRDIRIVGIVLAAASTLIYYLIGFGVITFPGGDFAGQTVFGLFAGTAFLAGTIAMVRYDKRALWVLGTLGLVFVTWAYFDVAPERDPSYEFWGIFLRVLQIPLLGIVGWLAMTTQKEGREDGR